MSETIHAFFDGLPASVDPARVSGIDDVFVFDIVGAGSWTVRFAADGAHCDEGAAADATCTIVAKAEHFKEIVAGKRNPMTAFMTGKLKVKGDLAAATRLKDLFVR
jgi:hypothetical protein